MSNAAVNSNVGQQLWLCSHINKLVPVTLVLSDA